MGKANCPQSNAYQLTLSASLVIMAEGGLAVLRILANLGVYFNAIQVFNSLSLHFGCRNRWRWDQARSLAISEYQFFKSILPGRLVLIRLVLRSFLPKNASYSILDGLIYHLHLNDQKRLSPKTTETCFRYSEKLNTAQYSQRESSFFPILFQSTDLNCPASRFLFGHNLALRVTLKIHSFQIQEIQFVCFAAQLLAEIYTQSPLESAKQAIGFFMAGFRSPQGSIQFPSFHSPRFTLPKQHLQQAFEQLALSVD